MTEDEWRKKRIRIDADLYPAFYLYVDPDPSRELKADQDSDPGQILKSQKVEFLQDKLYLKRVIGKKTCPRR